MLKLDGQLDSRWNRISKPITTRKTLREMGPKKIPTGPRVPEKSPWKAKPGMKIDGKISAGADRKPSIKIGNSTKLYSSFYEDDILNELLEKAFCDGYEYAQREFNSKSQKKLNRDQAISASIQEYNSIPKNERSSRDEIIKDVRQHIRSAKGYDWAKRSKLNDPKTAVMERAVSQGRNILNYKNVDKLAEKLPGDTFIRNQVKKLEKMGMKTYSSKSQKAMRKALEIAEAKKNMKVPEFISSEFKTIKNPEYEKALNKEIGMVRYGARGSRAELGTINRSINDKAVYRRDIGYNLTPSKKNAKQRAFRGDKSLQMSRDHGVFARDINNIVDSNKSVADTIKLNRKWNSNKRVVEIVKKRKN